MNHFDLLLFLATMTKMVVLLNENVKDKYVYVHTTAITEEIKERSEKNEGDLECSCFRK